jgi:hypothetical protein
MAISPEFEQKRRITTVCRGFVKKQQLDGAVDNSLDEPVRIKGFPTQGGLQNHEAFSTLFLPLPAPLESFPL